MNASRDPLPVSVVIPAFDAGATIAATLDSLAAQTRRAAEVVVVDDGSRDDTAAVVAAHPIGARLLRQTNGGLARARNAGVSAATQPWIVLLDADDLCDARRLEVQWSVFGALPDTGLCASDFSMFDQRGPLPGARAEDYYTALGRHPGGRAALLPQVRRIELADGGVTVRSGRLYPRIALGNVLHPPTLMFPRSLLERVGPFPEDVGSMSDFVWIVAAAMVAPVAFIDEPLLAYRLSETQMSAARYSLRRAIDRLRAYVAIAAADPALPRLLGSDWRAAIGETHLDIADAAAGEQRRRSLGHLVRSLAAHHVESRSFKTLAKNLLPAALIAAWRRRRQGA